MVYNYMLSKNWPNKRWNSLRPLELLYLVNKLFMFILFPCLQNLKTFLSPCSHSVTFSKMALRCLSVCWELTQRSTVPSQTQTPKSPTWLTNVFLSKTPQDKVKKPTVLKTILKSSRVRVQYLTLACNCENPHKCLSIPHNAKSIFWLVFH